MSLLMLRIARSLFRRAPAAGRVVDRAFVALGCVALDIALWIEPETQLEDDA